MQQTKDWLTHGLLFDGQIALVAANTRNTVEDARRIHDTWPVCTAALGRLLTGGLMMAVGLKQEEASVTLCINGGGPAGVALAVAQPDATVRGYITNPHVELAHNAMDKLDVGGALGRDGTLSVVRDDGVGRPYSGQVPLSSGEVGEDIAAYYLQSQQQPSAVYVGVKVDGAGKVLRAGGMLVSPLPNCQDWAIDALEAYLDSIGNFADALERGDAPQKALCSLFGEEDFELLETLRPRFACNCSEQRMERALLAMGRKDLEELSREDTGIDIGCHFCNSSYHFTQEQLQNLLEKA